jgi:hypothetical protein
MQAGVVVVIVVGAVDVVDKPVVVETVLLVTPVDFPVVELEVV